MLKTLIATVATLGFVTAAFAADFPRRQPPPPVAEAPVVGKMPIGKSPVGKYPVAARY